MQWYPTLKVFWTFLPVLIHLSWYLSSPAPNPKELFQPLQFHCSTCSSPRHSPEALWWDSPRQVQHWEPVSYFGRSKIFQLPSMQLVPAVHRRYRRYHCSITVIVWKSSLIVSHFPFFSPLHFLQVFDEIKPVPLLRVCKFVSEEFSSCGTVGGGDTVEPSDQTQLQTHKE